MEFIPPILSGAGGFARGPLSCYETTLHLATRGCAAARRYFDRELTLIHGFNHAEGAFNANRRAGDAAAEPTDIAATRGSEAGTGWRAFAKVRSGADLKIDGSRLELCTRRGFFRTTAAGGWDHAE